MVKGTSVCAWALLLACCLYRAGAERAVDCCLQVSHREIPKHIVRGYSLQVGGQGCDISAVVFTTKKQLKLCAPLGVQWVSDMIDSLEKLRKKCKSLRFMRKRCRSLI